MARINVEDSLLTDQRFLDLAIKLGSVQHALGAMVWAWRQGQKHYLSVDTDRCIPFDEWEKQRCEHAIITVGLAIKREKGIWIVGADKQFAWLEQRKIAGEKSAKSRKKSPKSCQRSSTVVEKTGLKVNGSEPLSSFLSSLSSNLNLNLPKSALSNLVERIYDEVYPRKIAKTEGKKLFMAEIKTVGDVTDLYFATMKYADYVADANNNVENIYGFAGFAEVWRQWIPGRNNLKAI